MAKINKDQRGKNNPCWKGGLPKCLDCGKQLKSYVAKRCGSHAMRLARKGKTGKLANNYIDGRSSKDYLERRRFRREMQKEIFKRDNYRCVQCGRRKEEGYELHVDHRVPKDKGGRATIENGQTLCSICNFRKKGI